MKYPVAVSVIMPCFNAEQFISEAINSIIEQTLTDWELIIIDDASTDATFEKIEFFNDPRIRVFRFTNNKGNYSARNFGLDHARGKYIAMLDADDVSLPNRLEMQYDYLEKYSRLGGIGCNYGFIDKYGTFLYSMNRTCNYGEFKIKLLSDNYMLQSTIFVRRFLLKKHNIRYVEKYRYASDYHFVFQCSKYFPILNIEESLVNYRFNPNSITATKFEEQQMYASEIRREILEYYFHSVLTENEIKIVDKVFNAYSRPHYIDPKTLEITFNKMLDYNDENRGFCAEGLYSLFNFSAQEYLKKMRDSQLTE